MRLVGGRSPGRQNAGPDRDRDRDRDRGAATVVACLGAVGLRGAPGGAGHRGAGVRPRHRAETGADLAALAGAAQLLRGVEVACAAADQVARANGVAVTGCRTDGLDLLVEVVAEVGGAFGGPAAGRARAGPDGPIRTG